MKYSQACLLKKQVDSLIKMLMMGVNLTDAVRMRLVVAHVSKSPKDLYGGLATA